VWEENGTDPFNALSKIIIAAELRAKLFLYIGGYTRLFMLFFNKVGCAQLNKKIFARLRAWFWQQRAGSSPVSRTSKWNGKDGNSQTPPPI
jgi:hypothetical protein